MINVTDHDRRYWQYEYDITARYLIPLLQKWGVPMAGVSLLDVGCGDGGNMCAMVDAGLRCKGFDLELRRVELAEHMKGNKQCEFRIGDLASGTRPSGEEPIFLAEIQKLARLKMGISVFENIVERAGLFIRARQFYLTSPNHIRFGIRPTRAGILGKIPGVRDCDQRRGIPFVKSTTIIAGCL